MATNTQLKFYKLGTNETMPETGLVTGAIYFVPKEGVIRVATSDTVSEPYGGKLSNAEWDSTKLVLTISKYDGSSLELDFSDMASSSLVSAEFLKHLGRIQTLENQIGFTGEEGSRQWTNNIEFYKNYTQKYDDSGNVKSDASAVIADTIGKEVDNLDAALHDLSVSVGKMATSEVVENLTTRVGTAENEIDDLQAVVSGYSGNSSIKNAIEAAQSAATTTIKADKDEIHIEISDTFDSTGEDKTANHAYTIKTKGIAKATDLSVLENTVTTHISNDFTSLKNKVDALSTATHFEGVVSWNPAKTSIGVKDENGDYTIDNAKYQSGDIVIYKPATGQSKEYILDGTGETPVFIELGDTTATDAAVTALDGRVAPLEVWKEKTSITVDNLGKDKLDKSVYDTFIGTTGEFGKLQSSVSTTNTVNNTRFGKIDSITGHPSVDASGVTAGYQPHAETEVAYIAGATSLDNADVKLDAAIKALDTRVGNTEKEVASVVGDSSTIQVTTNERIATVSALTGAITSNTSGLAKAADVYEALCWVEFN